MPSFLGIINQKVKNLKLGRLALKYIFVGPQKVENKKSPTPLLNSGVKNKIRSNLEGQNRLIFLESNFEQFFFFFK